MQREMLIRAGTQRELEKNSKSWPVSYQANFVSFCRHKLEVKLEASLSLVRLTRHCLVANAARISLTKRFSTNRFRSLFTLWFLLNSPNSKQNRMKTFLYPTIVRGLLKAFASFLEASLRSIRLSNLSASEFGFVSRRNNASILGAPWNPEANFQSIFESSVDHKNRTNLLINALKRLLNREDLMIDLNRRFQLIESAQDEV